MISLRMRRPFKVIVNLSALVAIAALAAACGTQKVSVPKSNPVAYSGAVLFSQRCAGCHTLSYAATEGSAAYVHDAQANNGPNFNVRCERPITRVLYAIQNGGFSGAYMPQNIVVGAQARAVARFVATYAGRQAPKVPGVPICQFEPIGVLPPSNAAAPTAITVTSISNSRTAAKTGSPSGRSTAKSTALQKLRHR
jgi:mono/diheme cytochrome c family protein